MTCEVLVPQFCCLEVDLQAKTFLDLHSTMLGSGSHLGIADYLNFKFLI